MPVNSYNPVVDGLLNAYGLAQRIQSMAAQKAELDDRKSQREQQRQERDYQHGRDQRADKIADENLQISRENITEGREDRKRRNAKDDLTTRMQLGTNPAIVPLAPGQTTRPVSTGQLSIRDMMMGIPSQLDSPIAPESTLSYEGQNYAMRSPEEMAMQRLQESRRLNGEALTQASALDKIKNPMVTLPGFDQPIRADLADNFLTHMDRVGDRKSRENVAGAREAGANRRHNESIVASKEAKKTAGEGNALQQKQYVNNLESEERKLQSKVSLLQADPKKSSELTGAKSQLRALREKKVAEGITKKATGDQVKAYAKKKGIDAAKAKSEFKASGFWVDDEE